MIIDKLIEIGIVSAAVAFVSLFCYGLYLLIFEDWS